MLDDWVRRDAPLLDADNDGNFDDPATAILNTAWVPLVQTVMRPVFGNLLTDLDTFGAWAARPASPTSTRT